METEMGARGETQGRDDGSNGGMPIMSNTEHINNSKDHPHAHHSGDKDGDTVRRTTTMMTGTREEADNAPAPAPHHCEAFLAG